MSELLRSIPGSLFLVLFWGVSILAMVVHGRVVDAGSPPAPGAESNLTPLEVGFLARKEQGVREVALVMAQQEKVVVLDSDQKRAHPVEGALSRHTATTELLEDLARSRGALDGISMIRTLKSVRSGLEAKKLICGKNKLLNIASGLLLYAPILAMAGTKLQLGILRGKPVLYLLLSMCLLGLFMLVFTFGTGDPDAPTSAARKILERRRKLLGPILQNSLSMYHRPDAIPMLAAAYGFRRMGNSSWADELPIIGLAISACPFWLPDGMSTVAFDPEASGALQSRFLFGSGGNRNGRSHSWSGSNESGCGGGSDSGGSGGGGDSGCGGGGGCGGCGGD